MRKTLQKAVSLALVSAMVMSISTTAFASENTNTAQTETATERAIKVNWWEIGWLVLKDYAEKLIDLDGQSIKNSNWAYLVSPDVEYNTGEVGPEIYFRPQVDSTVGTIRMHGHRVIFVDIFSQLALILSDASGETVSQATTGTNQYMFYTKTAADTSGKWKAQFVSTETLKWQLYYAHYYNANTRSSLPELEDGFYFGDNNRVYQFSDVVSHKGLLAVPTVLDLTELNNQFINQADGKMVDYLADFNASDTVDFADVIVDISYDSTENATIFYFNEDTYGEKIGWKFNGDLTAEYMVGDTMNLSFDVLNTATYQGITFESLDYFEAAFSHETGTPYPNINDYR